MRAVLLLPLVLALTAPLGVGQRRKMKRLPKQTKQSALAHGTWGGLHLRMEVTDKGARLEYDCAHGSINQKIVVDAGGHFEVGGVYVPERGGPIRQDQETSEQPVVYIGTVRGQSMTVRVKFAGEDEEGETFTLTHGSEGQLMKCR